MYYRRVVGLFLAIVFVAMAGVGCNTVKGAGKDIQKGGEAVENAADDARR